MAWIMRSGGWLFLIILTFSGNTAQAAANISPAHAFAGNLEHVRFHVTDKSVTAEQMIIDPALFHGFSKLKPSQTTLRTSEQQKVWLLVEVTNPFPENWQVYLNYHFLPADSVSFYHVAADIPSATFLGKTGSLSPFSERALPFLSFSQPVTLDANARATFLIGVEDAALVGTELSVTTLPTLVRLSQQALLLDSMINGVLLVLVCVAWSKGWLQKQPALFALGTFYIAFSLVLGTLNGLAFSLLWPDNPELNPVMLYITVGAALLSLTLFQRGSLLIDSGKYSFYFNNLCIALSLLLLFCPLYADGKLKLTLLFICVTTVLMISVLQVLFINLTSHFQHSLRLSLLAAAATLNLLLVQTRNLSSLTQWLDVGILLLLILSILLLIGILRRAPT